LNKLRQQLTKELLKIDGVTEKHWPDRDDGFSSFEYHGKDFAHFHHDNELDVRLGKQIIKANRVPRPTDSEPHPNRAAGSPWIELRYHDVAEVEEVVRLIKMAICGT